MPFHQTFLKPGFFSGQDFVGELVARQGAHYVKGESWQQHICGLARRIRIFGYPLQSHNAIAEQADARDGVATKLSNEMGNKHCSLVPRLQPNSSPEYCPRAV